MSEQPKIDYTDVKANAHLAEHVAYTEEPFRVGIDRATEIGEIATASQLAGLQTVASLQAREDYSAANSTLTEPTSSSEVSSQSAHKSSEAEQASFSPEQLRQLTGQHFFIARTHIGNQQRTLRHMPEDLFDSQKGQLTLSQGPMLHALEELSLSRRSGPSNDVVTEKENKSLNGMGVSELITFSPAEEYFTGRHVSGKLAEEAQGKFVLDYRTTATGVEPYEFRDFRGRPGNRLHYSLLIEDGKTAEELLQAIEQDPNVARQLAEVMITETPHLNERGGTDMSAPAQDGIFKGTKEEWTQRKPPYEQWQAINGGVNRVAIRTDVTQPIEQSKVVEF